MKNKETEEILYVLKHIVIGRATRLTSREADKLLSCIEQLEKNRDKALKIIDSYDLGKYDYSIPAGGIIELREALKGDSDD